MVRVMPLHFAYIQCNQGPIGKHITVYPHPFDYSTLLIFNYFKDIFTELIITNCIIKALYEAKHNGRNQVIVFDCEKT